MIYRAKLYAPHLSNYSAAAGGRSFPSAAGFHTSKTFFTDDEGVYLLDNRDSPACGDRAPDGSLDFEAVKTQVKKVRDGRLGVPAEVPYVEAHNTWVVNQAGTLLVIPVADLAQHLLLGLCYFLQNGAVIRDDVHGCLIPGIEEFKNIVDVEKTWPLSFVEQWSLTEVTAELSTSCYAGALMLQAMGLGGWMFNGMDPFSVLGASGNPAVPGMGFRFDTNERWPYPNPTGLAGMMEGYCPPHFSGMREFRVPASDSEPGNCRFGARGRAADPQFQCPSKSRYMIRKPPIEPWCQPSIFRNTASRSSATDFTASCGILNLTAFTLAV